MAQRLLWKKGVMWLHSETAWTCMAVLFVFLPHAPGWQALAGPLSHSGKVFQALSI
jgi:hypothetical protein